MAYVKFSRKQRLVATVAVSLCFFVAELAAGFYTHSLALVADSLHYLSDLVGFVVSLTALVLSESPNPPPKGYTFGWQRATLLGALFNGVFLLALGLSLLMQAIERFTNATSVEKPQVVLIMGCVGLAFNILLMSFLHEHDHDQDHCHGHDHKDGHETDSDKGSVAEMGVAEEGGPQPGPRRSNIAGKDDAELEAHCGHKHNAIEPPRPGRDLGMLGALVHVAGDAINNIGVIAAALVMWNSRGEARFYADPAVGVLIAIMIVTTAIPLTRSSGGILLQTAPSGIDVEDVKHDIEKVPGVESVHELHIWRLTQHKTVASAHIVVDSRTVDEFADQARVIVECLHAYGIHSATLQPETPRRPDAGTKSGRDRAHCQLACGELCGEVRCCAPVQEK